MTTKFVLREERDGECNGLEDLDAQDLEAAKLEAEMIVDGLEYQDNWREGFDATIMEIETDRVWLYVHTGHWEEM